MKIRSIYGMLFLAVAIFSACGGKHDHDHNDHEGHEHTDEPKEEKANDEIENDGTIMFSNEQAKNVLDFKIDTLKKQTFHHILKTSGQVLSAPGDEVLISATMSGIVKIAIPELVDGYKVNSGQQLFSISSQNLSENNTSTRLNEAKAILSGATAELERAQALIKDRIISQKEFEQAKLAHEQAKLNYQTLANGMSGNGKSISSPIGGYIKNIDVQSGQYVEIGQTLATVSQNKRLILRADVSQRYLPLIKNAKTATFTTPYDNKTYDLADLNGRLISIGKSSSDNAFYTPVSFDFENKGNVIEGSFVEVYLKSMPINDALVLPTTALIEEQGKYFVFVALDHEGEYQKKEVKTGATDGINRQILEGISEGDKVVSKGAYALKLISMSSAMPEHSHSH